MKKFKKLSITLAITSLLASATAIAQDVEEKQVNQANSIETMLKVNIGDVLKDTSKRSDSRTTQDLNDNEKSALQSSIELLQVKQTVSKLEYIEKHVPIDVRVQGIEASLTWIQEKSIADKEKRGTNVVWASSNENLYVPIGGDTNNNQVSTNDDSQNNSALTNEDILKLKELGLVIPGKEVVETATPTPETTPQQNSKPERVFVSATGVEASRVVIMGENKHFSGKVNFDISLSKGKEETVHSLNRANVGHKFSVNAIDFIIADLKKDQLSILNLGTGEVKNFSM